MEWNDRKKLAVLHGVQGFGGVCIDGTCWSRLVVINYGAG